MWTVARLLHHVGYQLCNMAFCLPSAVSLPPATVSVCPSLFPRDVRASASAITRTWCASSVSVFMASRLRRLSTLNFQFAATFLSSGERSRDVEI